jgi:hypothetical protein
MGYGTIWQSLVFAIGWALHGEHGVQAYTKVTKFMNDEKIM